MIGVVITRAAYLSTHTPGALQIIGMTHMPIYTLEEPWRDNLENVSCIPAGHYSVRPHGWDQNTKCHKVKCWELNHVTGRTGVLIHEGNTTNDILGCILVGLKRGTLGKLPAVLQSGPALTFLRKTIGAQPFQLTIVAPPQKKESTNG